jgi:3D (Asp-Asp-Asp) domain-containing protein
LPGGTTSGCLRLLGIAAALSWVLAIPGVSPAARNATVQGLRAQDATLAGRTRSAVLDLYSLDSQAAAAEARLARLQALTRSLRSQRARLAGGLRLARVTAAVSQRRLASRLRYLYDHGPTSSIELLLGARSIDEALTNIEDLHRVASADDAVLHEARSAAKRLARLRGILADRSRSLERAKDEAVAIAARLSQARAARAAYVARLQQQRRATVGLLAKLQAEAEAATSRARRLPAATPAPAALAARTVPLAAGGARTLTVTITGYALAGRTATGLPAGWGVAAVDPSVIPLGTHLTIPGYGEAVAADTGSGVTGATVDLWFPTSSQAERWGRRSITISLH